MKGQTVSSINLTAVIPLNRIDESTLGLEENISLAIEAGIKVVLIMNSKILDERLSVRSKFTHFTEDELLLVENNFSSPGLARNIGVQSCKTDYITFWDPDDFPEILEVCGLTIELSENQTKNYAVGSFQIVDTRRNVLSSHIIHENRECRAQVIRNPGIWRWIFRTEKVRMVLFKDFMMGEDQDFISDLNPKESEILTSKSVIYSYVKGWRNQLTGSQEAIDEIILSIKYLHGKLKNKTANPWLTNFLYRQLLTGLRRGSLRIKLRSLGYLLRYLARL